VLNEFARASDVCIRIDEKALPIRAEVRGICEILGIDPLYLANEGKLVAVVPASYAQVALEAMRQNEAGKDSTIIAEIFAAPKETVILKTIFGGERIVDMLVGDQLPRIC
jgi:hydrogenase expression/formation protein HypE